MNYTKTSYSTLHFKTFITKCIIKMLVKPEVQCNDLIFSKYLKEKILQSNNLVSPLFIEYGWCKYCFRKMILVLLLVEIVNFDHLHTKYLYFKIVILLIMCNIL